MSVTMMANMINPEVMGDMINAKIEALLKITPYAHLDTSLQGVPGDTNPCQNRLVNPVILLMILNGSFDRQHLLISGNFHA